MKKRIPFLVFAFTLLIAFISCEKDDTCCRECVESIENHFHDTITIVDKSTTKPDEENSIIDFTYSIVYSIDSVFVTIGMMDVSNTGSVIEHNYWYLNGSYVSSGPSASSNEYSNGHYAIVHKIMVKDVEYSLSKEFDITGIR